MVDDFNILEDQWGAVKWGRFMTLAHKFRMIRRYLRQEISYALKGPAVPRDRKTRILDIHTAHRYDDLRGRYDALLSSNLLEHSPNPIFMLLNFHFMTNDDGWQFHAIPHYRYTYDVYREPTSLDHMIQDFVGHADASDASHVADYLQSAVERHGYMREFYRHHPVAFPYIHFHVFDEANTRALMEFMFEEVVNDLLTTPRFSDNVVLFRNRLKSSFARDYSQVIVGYASTLLAEVNSSS
jgi:hypothetical protein